jgi:hypothetical protein
VKYEAGDLDEASVPLALGLKTEVKLEPGDCREKPFIIEIYFLYKVPLLVLEILRVKGKLQLCRLQQFDSTFLVLINIF